MKNKHDLGVLIGIGLGVFVVFLAWFLVVVI